jgi:hypothetical protein
MGDACCPQVSALVQLLIMEVDTSASNWLLMSQGPFAYGVKTLLEQRRC